MEQVTNTVVAQERESGDRMAAAGSLGAAAVVALAFVALSSPAVAVVAAVGLAAAAVAKRWGLGWLRSTADTRNRTRRDGHGPVTAD